MNSPKLYRQFISNFLDFKISLH